MTFEKTTGDARVKIGVDLIAYIEAFKRDQIELSQQIADPAVAAVLRQAAATTEVAISVGQTIMGSRTTSLRGQRCGPSMGDPTPTVGCGSERYAAGHVDQRIDGTTVGAQSGQAALVKL